MKKFNVKKIILIILILLIISGIIILGTIGFKKSTLYESGTRIEVYIPKGYNKQEVYDIAENTFADKNFSIQEIEKFNQVFGIKIKNYTQDELNNFKKSICEKYEIEEDSLELYEISVPTTRISTTIAPYILPVLLTTLLSFVYVFFRNLKEKNKWKIIGKIILTLVITMGIYFTLILIFRLPYGSYTIPVALVIYVATLIILVHNIKK